MVKFVHTMFARIVSTKALLPRNEQRIISIIVNAAQDTDVAAAGEVSHCLAVEVETFLSIHLLSGGGAREEVIQTQITLSSGRRASHSKEQSLIGYVLLPGWPGVSGGLRNVFADATGCSAGKLYSIMV